MPFIFALGLRLFVLPVVDYCIAIEHVGEMNGKILSVAVIAGKSVRSNHENIAVPTLPDSDFTTLARVRLPRGLSVGDDLRFNFMLLIQHRNVKPSSLVDPFLLPSSDPVGSAPLCLAFFPGSGPAAPVELPCNYGR